MYNTTLLKNTHLKHRQKPPASRRLLSVFANLNRAPLPGFFMPCGRGIMDIVFLLSALVVAWAGFCLLLSSNGKVPKIAGVPYGDSVPFGQAQWA